jgi:sugar (pentulose or hexulose) kinase
VEPRPKVAAQYQAYYRMYRELYPALQAL